jgi:hypothetical protein
MDSNPENFRDVKTTFFITFPILQNSYFITGKRHQPIITNQPMPIILFHQNHAFCINNLIVYFQAIKIDSR